MSTQSPLALPPDVDSAPRRRSRLRYLALPAAAAIVAVTAGAGTAMRAPAAASSDNPAGGWSALDNGPAASETWYDPQRVARDPSGDATSFGSLDGYKQAADLRGMDAYLSTAFAGHDHASRYLHVNVARANAPTSGTDDWGVHDSTLTFTWRTGTGKSAKTHRSTLVETWRVTGKWTVAIGHKVTTDGGRTDVTSEAAHQNPACGWVRDTASTRYQHFVIPVRCIGSGSRPVKVGFKLTVYNANLSAGASDSVSFPNPLALNGPWSYQTATESHQVLYPAPNSPLRQTLSQTADGKTIVFTQQWSTPQNLEASPKKLSWDFLHEYDSFDYSVFPLDQVDPDGTVHHKMVAHWWDNRSATGGGGEWGCGATEAKYTVSSDRKSVRMTLPWRCLPWDTVRIATVYDGPSATIHRR